MRTGTDSPVSSDSSTSRSSAFEERCVRRNAIAFGKNDHVAARHFPARYPLALAVADDERAGTRQVSKRLENPLGAHFLNHRDHDSQDGEDEEKHGLSQVAERQVDDAARDEQGDHGFAQHLEDDFERRAAVGLGSSLYPSAFSLA